MAKAVINARLINSSTVAALDIVVTAPDPVTALRKRLLNAGHDPSVGLTVWRGGRVWQSFEYIGNTKRSHGDKRC